MLKVSAFYLENQKSFIPKKIFFRPVSKHAKIIPKDGASCPNFQWRFWNKQLHIVESWLFCVFSTNICYIISHLLFSREKNWIRIWCTQKFCAPKCLWEFFGRKSSIKKLSWYYTYFIKYPLLMLFTNFANFNLIFLSRMYKGQ